VLGDAKIGSVSMDFSMVYNSKDHAILH